MGRFLLTALVAVATVGAGGCQSPRPRVLLVSVDGLWARDLERAESAGAVLPVLDSLRRAGALAAGVIGSFPSVTYPSHTTMVTGVPPARHGVYSNGRFSPPSDTTRVALSYWEADWVRVPGVFEAARAAGLKSAAVNWPVTAHHASIDYNIPDAWDPWAPDSVLVALRRLGTSWLLDSLGAPRAGEWSDSLRAQWTSEIVRRWDPDLVLLHLLALDHWKHEQGPVGDSVWVALRHADRYIGWVLSALRAPRPRTTTVIVTSDHGFLPYGQQLRAGVLLAQAGLVTLDSAGRVTAWDAAVFSNGGSVVILPRDSTDQGLAGRVRAAIPDSFIGPGKPIRAVWPRDTIAALGGDPRAIWALDMNEGFYAVGGYRGALLASRRGGGHGYDPRRPELHAFFLAAGPGVPVGATLPVIRQTDIAPTIAAVLGIRLHGVEGRPISFARTSP